MFSREKQMEQIHQDRREDRRYPIQLEIRYKVVTRNRAAVQGTGHTVNISSGGVLFAGEQALPAGAFAELSINWPIMLQGTCPLTLLVVGRVIRCHENKVAVKMNRYEFHTRPNRAIVDGLPSAAGKAYIA